MKIRLPVSEARSSEPWAACIWIGHFVNIAIDEGGYEESELPEDAIRFANLCTYLSEQTHGGHEQFGGSIQGNEKAWRNAAELLGLLGMPAHSALLNAFITFAGQNRDRVEELYAVGNEVAARKLFYSFDDQFAAIDREGFKLLNTLHNWLLRQPWLDLDYDDAPATMDSLRRSFPPHPLSKQRQAARLRQRLAENHGQNLAMLQRLRGILSDRQPPK